MSDYAPLFDLNSVGSYDYLQDEARHTLERDAKHSLKSPDDNERLDGIRTVELFNY
jgi:hypothetical protein